MTYNTQTVTLRELIADDGMVITDKNTQKIRATKIYLGKNERRDNYLEIDEDTPIEEENNDD